MNRALVRLAWVASHGRTLKVSPFNRIQDSNGNFLGLATLLRSLFLCDQRGGHLFFIDQYPLIVTSIFLPSSPRNIILYCTLQSISLCFSPTETSKFQPLPTIRPLACSSCDSTSIVAPLTPSYFLLNSPHRLLSLVEHRKLLFPRGHNSTLSLNDFGVPDCIIQDGFQTSKYRHQSHRNLLSQPGMHRNRTRFPTCGLSLIHNSASIKQIWRSSMASQQANIPSAWDKPACLSVTTEKVRESMNPSQSLDTTDISTRHLLDCHDHLVQPSLQVFD